MFHFGFVWMAHVERWLFTKSFNHTDARQCRSVLFYIGVKVPMCFWIHTTFFPVVVPSFLYTSTLTHTHETQNIFCDCKSGSPWRRDHTDITHNLWVSEHFVDTHSCFLFFANYSFKWSCLSRTQSQHINTTKSTTAVRVYKYIPFFQHKVYTFFYRGGILSVLQVVCTPLVK